MKLTVSILTPPQPKRETPNEEYKSPPNPSPNPQKPVSHPPFQSSAGTCLTLNPTSCPSIVDPIINTMFSPRVAAFLCAALALSFHDAEAAPAQIQKRTEAKKPRPAIPAFPSPPTTVPTATAATNQRAKLRRRVEPTGTIALSKHRVHKASYTSSLWAAPTSISGDDAKRQVNDVGVEARDLYASLLSSCLLSLKSFFFFFSFDELD